MPIISPPPLRHLIGGYLRDTAEKPVWLSDLVATHQPLQISDVQDLLLAKAARIGRNDLHRDPRPGGDVVVPLLPIPRPPAEDVRPLLAWTVKIYFVCHDVKFGGYSEGVFAWPEEPTGAVLDTMIWLLMNEELATRDFQPSGERYSDLVSVDVTPSTSPPEAYR